MLSLVRSKAGPGRTRSFTCEHLPFCSWQTVLRKCSYNKCSSVNLLWRSWWISAFIRVVEERAGTKPSQKFSCLSTITSSHSPRSQSSVTALGATYKFSFIAFLSVTQDDSFYCSCIFTNTTFRISRTSCNHCPGIWFQRKKLFHWPIEIHNLFILHWTNSPDESYSSL